MSDDMTVAKSVFVVLQEYLTVFKEHQKQEWLSVIQQSFLHNCPKAFYTVVLV